MTDELLKFEIQAGIAVDAVENMACENPQIYVYEIDHETSQLPVSIAAEYNTSELTQSQIDSLNDLPGSSENGGVFYIPEYKMIADVDEISDKMSGIQFEFENMPKVAQDNVLVDEYYWSTDSTYYTKPLTGLFLYPDFEYSNQSTYDRRLNFDYLIEFFDTPRGDTVTNVYCNTFPTVLPYRITNLTTGKKVYFNP